MKFSNEFSIDWKRIRIIDRYLIIIMIILILYSILTLCFGFSETENSVHMDSFIRTTIVSIFGYFISSNFIKNEQIIHELPYTQEKAPLSIPNEEQKTLTITSNMGFISDPPTNDDTSNQQSTGIVPSSTENYNLSVDTSANKLQIQIVGILCVFSIIIMMATRFFTGITATELPIITQFQGIICASIGFLIGMPTESTK